MTEEHTIRTRVIVVSHGTGELSENENLLRVVDALSSKFTDVDVTPFRISTGKALSGFIAQHAADRRVIVPLLFSRGYFFTRKIEQEVARISGQHAIEVLPPIIEWPEFREMVGAEIGPDEFLGVAHGSKRSSASREAAEQFFSSVAEEAAGKVRCGFLEEPPFAVDVAKEMESAIAVGLFLERGRHGGGDFTEVSEQLPEASGRHFIVGDLSSFPKLICDKVAITLNT